MENFAFYQKSEKALENLLPCIGYFSNSYAHLINHVNKSISKNIYKNGIAVLFQVMFVATLRKLMFENSMNFS